MAGKLTVLFFRNRIYKCDNSPQFFTTIIDKMETLDPPKLCSTLNAFFQRSDSLIAYSVGVVLKLLPLQNSCAMLWPCSITFTCTFLNTVCKLQYLWLKVRIMKQSLCGFFFVFFVDMYLLILKSII